MAGSDILIETDARGRANLSRFGKNARFLAREADNGDVILQRAVVMTEAEARLHRNPEALKAIESFLSNQTDVVERKV